MALSDASGAGTPAPDRARESVLARQRFRLARHRLGGADFARIYKQGRRAHGVLFAVVVLENELERTRLGLSVSKRRARRAVDRNRVRRLFREAFRLSLASLPIGVDVVMIATVDRLRPELDSTRAELVALVAKALKKKPRAAPPGRSSGAGAPGDSAP